jgi:uncharacterized protein (TIGR02646 family)
MKYIIKSNSPELFQKWVDENDEELQKLHSGDAIWTVLKSKREEWRALQESVLNEQGFICVYCGMRIGKNEGETFSVEHFKAKSSFQHLTLRYTNLFGCCKLSQDGRNEKTEDFPIKDKPELRKLGEIADWFDVEIDNIKRDNPWLKNYDENTDLVFENNRKPDNYKINKLIFRGSIHHCDDTKLGDTEKEIIDPTQEDCEKYFTYEEVKYKSGKLGCGIYNPIDDGIVKDTIDILKLNAPNLCEKRLKAFQTGYEDADLYGNAGFNIEQIEEIIENDIYKKKEGKFDEFCFVRASVIRSFFSF